MDGRHIMPRQTLLPQQRSSLIIRWHDFAATDRQQMLQEIRIQRRGNLSNGTVGDSNDKSGVIKSTESRQCVLSYVDQNVFRFRPGNVGLRFKDGDGI